MGEPFIISRSPIQKLPLQWPPNPETAPETCQVLDSTSLTPASGMNEDKQGWKLYWGWLGPHGLLHPRAPGEHPTLNLRMLCSWRGWTCGPSQLGAGVASSGIHPVCARARSCWAPSAQGAAWGREGDQKPQWSLGGSQVNPSTPKLLLVIVEQRAVHRGFGIALWSFFRKSRSARNLGVLRSTPCP